MLPLEVYKLISYTNRIGIWLIVNWDTPAHTSYRFQNLRQNSCYKCVLRNR